MAVVPVDLAGRAYEVRVGAGLLADLPAQCGALLRKARVPIVTDANVARHWRAAVDTALAAAGFEPRWLVLEPGEAAKSWATLERVVDWLLAEEVVARIERAGDAGQLRGVVGHWHMALRDSKHGRAAAGDCLREVRDALREAGIEA